MENELLQTRTTRVQTIIVGCALLLLVGCSQHQELADALEDYHARLASVLETESVDVAFVADIQLPNKSELFRQPQAMSFNLREFYALPDCRLNTLIAQRNTSMGKTQLPSQRFVYETDLLKALEECLAVTDDPGIQTSLKSVLTFKQENYADAYANLIQTSDELRLMIEHAQRFVSGDTTDGFQETRFALQYLTAIGETKPPDSETLTSEDLEQALKDLAQFRLVGRLWRSQQLLSEWLEISTPWLQAQTQNLNCENRKQKQKAEYLHNVFMMFFAEQIQPIAGQINHYHYQLLPIFNKLIADDRLDPAFRLTLENQTDTQHQRYKQAVQQHILLWQQLFKQCGLSPVLS